VRVHVFGPAQQAFVVPSSPALPAGPYAMRLSSAAYKSWRFRLQRPAADLEARCVRGGGQTGGARVGRLQGCKQF
jgi:hypothetical protein